MLVKRLLTLYTAILPAVMFGAAVIPAHAGPGGAPQASITLYNSDAALCNADNTDWSLSKTGVFAAADPAVPQVGTVTWTVTATKLGVSHKMLKVNGYVQVTNTGSANATIGNIVVNLQHQVTVGAGKNKKTYWISAAADVADSKLGDAATQDNIVTTASAEDATLNGSVGPKNYLVNMAQGMFKETTGTSGTLEFTDADSNTLFSLMPQQSLAPGQTVNLLFTANFDNTNLGLQDGELVRPEVIVTFGNAGGRGGSGASATGIDDSDGNTTQYVRSVPTRITKSVPVTEHCNASVTLTDPGPVTDPGGVVAGAFDNSSIGADGLQITDTTAVTVSVPVDGGMNGGQVGNDAFLNGDSDSVSISGPVDPATLTAPLYMFPCCVGVSLDAGSMVDVPGGVVPPSGFHDGDFLAFTRAHWGNKVGSDASAVSILTDNFATVYPNGVTVGGIKTMKFTTAAAVTAYLGSLGGSNGALTASSINPTSTSSGAFGGSVLALQINVDYSAASATPSGFGALIVHDPGASLDGMTVNDVLVAANVALGGGCLPTGYTFTSLDHLVSQINLAFDQGKVHGFAGSLLSH